MRTPMTMSPIGKLFAAIATIEAITWAGLLSAMYLKYGSGTTDVGVWWFGRLHGAAFLAYLVIAVIAGHRLRWPVWRLVVAILAAIPPLMTLPLEAWLLRRGWLAAPAEPSSGQ